MMDIKKLLKDILNSDMEELMKHDLLAAIKELEKARELFIKHLTEIDSTDSENIKHLQNAIIGIHKQLEDTRKFLEE
ncbi:hypothetical protein [Alteromonas sp. W364]|uniref:hypothetical protein n=1 Tax=Alteromonas sp. W364 TaxID=3075610 RepID=UPI0028868963|nr:hypothetical protein [Alteromonas sp. W364]MDT0626884.1 hypothetical protein [Alteromonas sp. W364]